MKVQGGIAKEIKLQCELGELSRDDLLEIKSVVEAALDKMIPVSVRPVDKKGPDGSIRTYIYATWSEDGRQKQVSLGAMMTAAEQEKRWQQLKRPRWYDFRVIGGKADDHEEDYGERSLDDDEFEEKYGLSRSEDNIGYPSRLVYDIRAYNWAVHAYNNEVSILISDWTTLGVGTLKGVTVLSSMFSSGRYYLKQSAGGGLGR